MLNVNKTWNYICCSFLFALFLLPGTGFALNVGGAVDASIPASTARYYPSASNTDQGAAGASSVNYTLYDIEQSVGTKEVAVILSHTGTADTTTYTLDTSIDWSAKPNVYLFIYPGARIARTTGDETLTLYSPENIIVTPFQQITAVDMIKFAKGGSVHPELWGAKNDNTTDSSDAIQYAINSFKTGTSSVHGTVLISNGAYRLTKTITVTAQDYLSIVGESRESSFFVRSTDYGNTILVEDECYGFTIAKIRMYNDFDVTYGAHLEIRKSAAVQVKDMHISDMFGGIYARGLWDFQCNNTIIDAGTSWTGYKSGSYSMRIAEYDGRYPATNYISDFSFSGDETYSDNCVVINASDGVWFNAGHLGFSANAAFLVTQGETTSLMGGILCTSVYFDRSGYGVMFYEKSGATAINGNHRFANCFFQAFGNDAIYMNEPVVEDVRFSQCQIRLAENHTVNVQRGKEISFTDVTINQANEAKAANKYGYLFANDVSNIRVTNGGITITGDDALDYGVVISDTASDIKISNVALKGTPTTGWFINTSSGTDIKIQDNTGYITENGGTSSAIATGGTIAHGLSAAPTVYYAIPTGTGPTDVYVTADSTNLTVNYTGGGSHAFSWEAKVR